MLDEAYNKTARASNLDKKIVSVPTQNSHRCADIVDKIKDSIFGQAIFITPWTRGFEHSVFCVAKDGSRLMQHVKIPSLNFYSSRGIQSGDALYVFFFDKPVRVKKITNLPREPIIKDLPNLPNKNKLENFAVSCVAESTIILTGGDSDGA